MDLALTKALKRLLFGFVNRFVKELIVISMSYPQRWLQSWSARWGCPRSIILITRSTTPMPPCLQMTWRIGLRKWKQTASIMHELEKLVCHWVMRSGQPMLNHWKHQQLSTPVPFGRLRSTLTITQMAHRDKIYHLFKNLLTTTDGATWFDKVKDGDGRAAFLLLWVHYVGEAHDMRRAAPANA